MSFFSTLGKNKWPKGKDSVQVIMSESFYILVRLQSDFSMKESEEQEDSPSFFTWHP